MNRWMGGLLALLWSLWLPVAVGQSAPTARSDGGMVVTAHPLATEVGAGVLERGGNAFDAAVAVHFALAVVLPRAGNLGGGGFALLHEAREQRVRALDFRETAPAAATRDMYLDEKSEVVPGKSTIGALAVGVPGSVRGMKELHDRYGTRPWRELLLPAVGLARRGFRVDGALARSLFDKREDLARFPETAAIFLRPDGTAWREGQTLIQTDLARTIERIAAEGAEGFYRGEVARQLVESMRRRGGILVREDLLRYRARWREPIRGRYRGHEIYSMPPPSSGGVCLLQMLGVLERLGPPVKGSDSGEAIHRKVETWRRVYADRSVHLGDPDHHPVPTDWLLSADYLGRVARSIDPGRATPSRTVRPGKAPAPDESEETTHFVVVDESGQVVTVTTTLNGSYGSRLVAAGTGVLLNNEMDDFSAKPGVPNLYGLVGGKANAIEPGKRMLSSMTPTLVFRGERPVLALGTPGGSTIITTVMQVVTAILDHGVSLPNAVEQVRVHHQWLPDVLFLERGLTLPSPVRRDLLRRGHRLVPRGPLGNVQAVWIDPASGLRIGVSDPRGDGRPLGVRRKNPK